MIKISESVAQQISEEWKSLPISVDQVQFKQFELLPIYLREHIWLQVQEHFKESIRPANENWIQWNDAELRQKWEFFTSRRTNYSSSTRRCHQTRAGVCTDMGTYFN